MPRFLFLPILLLVLPVAELVVLGVLGSSCGWLETLGFLLAGGIAGIGLCRGQAPLTPVWTAGVCFAVPGLLSDVLGLVLLIPPARRLLLLGLIRSLALPLPELRVEPGDESPEAWPGGAGEEQGGSASHRGGGRVRDVAYRMLTPDPPPAKEPPQA